MKKSLFAVVFILFSWFAGAQSNWKTSIQTWTFHKYTLMEALDKAGALGFSYVEVYPGQTVGGQITGPFSYNLDKKSRDYLKNYFLKKNIRVIALGVVDKDYYNKDNLEKFFEFAKYMGISFITAEPEWKDLDEFDRLAGKYGVKVALHCHPKPNSHYWQPDSMIHAMKGRKNIGTWPDIGHWARSGVPIIPALKKIQGTVWGLHFKDVRQFDNTSAIDTLFGTGVCDLPAVMNELKRQKFNGVVSIEYEAHEDNNMGDMQFNKNYFDARLKKLK